MHVRGRAMNIPARYVCGYLPDIAVPYNPIPMDFHAWIEVLLPGAGGYVAVPFDPTIAAPT
jgi:transglutaminase-like putative cysteine protease